MYTALLGSGLSQGPFSRWSGWHPVALHYAINDLHSSFSIASMIVTSPVLCSIPRENWNFYLGLFMTAISHGRLVWWCSSFWRWILTLFHPFLTHFCVVSGPLLPTALDFMISMHGRCLLVSSYLLIWCLSFSDKMLTIYLFGSSEAKAIMHHHWDWCLMECHRIRWLQGVLYAIAQLLLLAQVHFPISLIDHVAFIYNI